MKLPLLKIIYLYLKDFYSNNIKTKFVDKMWTLLRFVDRVYCLWVLMYELYKSWFGIGCYSTDNNLRIVLGHQIHDYGLAQGLLEIGSDHLLLISLNL